MIVFILICILFILLLINYLWHGRYWSRYRINGPLGLPIFGNMLQFAIGNQHYSQVYDQIYRNYPDAKYVGFYRFFNNPSILIRDLDLIKEIMIKSFTNFHDNALYMSVKRDPLVAINPFVAKGELWKLYRNQIVTAFTPNKVKSLFPYIHDVSQKLNIYISQGSGSDNPTQQAPVREAPPPPPAAAAAPPVIINNQNSFEAKTLCSMFTLEVVASCGFGLEGQTFTNENSDFMKLVKDIFQPRQFVLLETISLLFLPQIGDLINYHYIPENIQKWLITIICQVMKQRQQSQETRNDFLQTLLDLKDKRGLEITETEIVGHCMTMLIEGFETSSTLMAFALYELAINPEIQSKIQSELDEIYEKHNGELTFDVVQELTYLEMVLLETLRLHPPMYTLFKLCTEPFLMPSQYSNSSNTNQEQVSVPIGTTFMIPVSAIHKDPDYYPNPLIFDPERFTEQNQRERIKCSYLGFGEGPRMCLGMRFGLLQSKTGLASMLSKFHVKLAPNCQTPIEMSENTFLLASKNGIYLQFEERQLK